MIENPEQHQQPPKNKAAQESTTTTKGYMTMTQTKNIKTTRSLATSLGKASILSLAIAGANSATALETDFGVTLRADAFNIDGKAFGTERSETGMANLLRIKANFKDEETGVSVQTSTQLSGDYWTGDARENTGPQYNNEGNETITLDYGFVQIPIAGNLIRVGRQPSNYNNGFLVSDDRRDRVISIFPTDIGTFTAHIDRRAASADEDEYFGQRDSGDQVVTTYTTKLGGFTTGFLYGYWLKSSGEQGGSPGYSFQGTQLVSSYASGQLTENVMLKTGLNYFWGNEATNPFTGEEDAYFFGSEGNYSDGLSAYISVEGGVDRLSWGAQYAGAIDGGFVANGYDTYSSLLNSSPDSTGNPTSLISMGRGYGLKDYDQHLLIGKIGFAVTPRLTVTGAVGYLGIDTGTNDDNSTIYDLSANYQINESVSTIASIGMITENEAYLLTDLAQGRVVPGSDGNALVPVGPEEFGSEDLVAAKLGLRVAF